MRELTVDEVASNDRGAIKIGPFGSALPRSSMVSSGIKVYGQENLIERDWSTGDRRISKETFQQLRSCELHPGDVVIGMMGSLGHCEVFPAEAEPGLMDSHLLRIQPDPAIVHPEYLRLLLLSEGTARQIGQLSHGSIMAGLSSKVVRRLVVPVPPLDEQRRIAEVLDTIDETIQATESIIEKLAMGRTGLLQELVPDRPGGDATEVELGSLIDPSRPIVYGILMPGDHVHGGVPVIKVKDIKGGAISDRGSLLHTSREIDEQYSRSRVAEGDLLFTIRGTVGRVAVVPADLDSANITQDTARLAVRGVDRSYLLAAMHTERFRRFVDVNTIGQAVKGINLRELRQAPILLTSRERQTAIGRTLDDADRLVKVELERLSALRATRSGLASDLLSGRVRTTPR